MKRHIPECADETLKESPADFFTPQLEPLPLGKPVINLPPVPIAPANRNIKRPSSVESDTDKFWRTYESQEWDRSKAAWQERDPHQAIAALEANGVAKCVRRDMLKRMIGAGQLLEAKREATGKTRARGLGRETTIRHITDMAEQRRELLQVRRRLERVVRKRQHRKGNTLTTMPLLTQQSAAKETNLLGAIEQNIISRFKERKDLAQAALQNEGSSSEEIPDDEGEDEEDEFESEGNSSSAANGA